MWILHSHFVTFPGAFDGTFGILSYGAIVLVLWYGGKLVHEGHVTAGLLTCKLSLKLEFYLDNDFVIIIIINLCKYCV